MNVDYARVNSTLKQRIERLDRRIRSVSATHEQRRQQHQQRIHYAGSPPNFGFRVLTSLKEICRKGARPLRIAPRSVMAQQQV